MCIVHGLHMCPVARVKFEYVYQLISILFLSKEITVNLELKHSDRIFGWQDLEFLQSQFLQCWELQDKTSHPALSVVNQAQTLVLGGRCLTTEASLRFEYYLCILTKEL